MISIIKRTLKDRLVSLISYSIGGIVLVWVYVALLPTVQESQAQMQEILKTFPEGLLKAFGIAGVDLGSLEALLSMKQFNLIWPLLLIFFVVSFAGVLIAGEIENRTIEIILSSAKSRVEIFFGKYLSGLLYLIIFSIATILCAIPIARLYGYECATLNYFTLLYLGLAFGWAIYSISFLFSSIFSSKGNVYLSSGAVLIVMYVLFIISTLKDNLKNLQYVSFFYYFDINKALIHNRIDLTAMLVFLGVGLISTILALIIFIRRDIAVF